MSGQPGRSGRRRKALGLHLLQGTYRKDRHGAIPESGAPVPPPPAYTWAPSDEDCGRLGPVGRAFLEEALRSHEYNWSAGLIVLMVATLMDSRAVLEADVQERGMFLVSRRGTKRLNPSVKERWRCARLIGQLLRDLKLGEGQ